MPTKEERAAEARKHVGLVRGVFGTDIQHSIDTAKVYEDGEGRDLPLPEPRFEATEAVVAWQPLAEAIDSASGKVCVVDPATYRNPGGNYLAGGWSPECQICAESTLFPVLEGLKKEYFEPNGQSMHGGLYSDRAVYLQDIAFTTEGVMRKRDVLAIAPPHRRFALENHRSEAECDQDLRNRITALMNIAAAHEPDTLVLTAFGCGGSYDNDPQAVADLFKAWLDGHPGQFERVVFAIAGGPALDAFREVFPELQRQVAEVVEETAEEETDDETVDIAPNADGRWVFE